jgi:coenzyme F420-0:L-glutamate ligase/coenzyme F420-1:gamma-L-glutamate ligase
MVIAWVLHLRPETRNHLRDSLLNSITLTALPGIPLISPGDDLALIIAEALSAFGFSLIQSDILVVAQKIVSKAEGRAVKLSEVRPSPRALELAKVVHKDPRLVEVILSESVEVVRTRPGLLIVRDKRGWVCANAGVDRSNVAQDKDADGVVLRLPLDPDASATCLRRELRQRLGVEVGVIVADSHGRPHRDGVIGVAIGVAGLAALEDWRGRPDLFGYRLQHTDVAVADQVASAATLLMGQAGAGLPVVVARGVPHTARDGSARELVRPPEMDMFR